MAIHVEFAEPGRPKIFGSELLEECEMDAVPRVGETVDMRGRMWTVAEVTWIPSLAEARVALEIKG